MQILIFEIATTVIVESKVWNTAINNLCNNKQTNRNVIKIQMNATSYQAQKQTKANKDKQTDSIATRTTVTIFTPGAHALSSDVPVSFSRLPCFLLCICMLTCIYWQMQITLAGGWSTVQYFRCSCRPFFTPMLMGCVERPDWGLLNLLNAKSNYVHIWTYVSIEKLWPTGACIQPASHTIPTWSEIKVW